MQRLPLITIGLAASCLMAAPSGASVIVLGNGGGSSCYQAARDGVGSQAAVETCSEALGSGMLSERDTVATFVNRGIVKLSGGDHAAAIVDFDRAIQLDPQEAESYLNKGSAIVRMGGNASQAIALFNEALARKTQKPELAYYARAIAHEVSGDLRSAYLDYKRASELAPRWEDPGRELSRFQVRRASSTN